MKSIIIAVLPNAKLVYNNLPSFNWTLNFLNQTYEDMLSGGKNKTAQKNNHYG